MQVELQYLSSASLADLFQVQGQLSVADLVIELIRRGWHAVPIDLNQARARNYQFEFALTLPEHPPTSGGLKLWEISDNDLTWDQHGRSNLCSDSSWPRERVIVTPASLCAVLRRLDGPDRRQPFSNNEPAYSDELLFLPDVVPLRDNYESYRHFSPLHQLSSQKPSTSNRAGMANKIQTQDLRTAQQPQTSSNWSLQRFPGSPRDSQSTDKKILQQRKVSTSVQDPCAVPQSTHPGPTEPLQQHRILTLGWKPSVTVHCNGLLGLFIGGHDRDLYIQCTSPEYQHMPLVGLDEGGCIMSCSQFEKKAGRSLSKKWKESIHVAGEGDGSKATLISWLKRQAAQRFGEDVVGKECWICWVADGTFYRATVISYHPDTGKHKVRYADRFVEDLHLPAELVSWDDERPEVPEVGLRPSTTGKGGARCITPKPSAAAAGASTLQKRPQSARRDAAPLLPPQPPQMPPQAAPQQQQQQQFVQHPQQLRVQAATMQQQQQQQAAMLRAGMLAMPEPEHVCNDVWQAYQDALHDVSTPVKSRLPLAGMGNVRGTEQMTLRAKQMLQVAQHLALGPGEAGAAGTMAMDMLPSSSQQQQQRTSCGRAPSAQPSSSDVAGSQHSGDGERMSKVPRMSELQRSVSWSSDLADFSPSVPASLVPARLASPPSGGYAECDVATMSRWMHALVVDVEEALLAYAAAEVGGSMQETLRLGSPAARFQALLVQCRGTERFRGYYEALLARYLRHMDNPTVQQRKLVEFMVGALGQGDTPQPASPATTANM